MSRSKSPDPALGQLLPLRPNLEHLRNECKQLLRGLRKRQPAAKLAAAQLQVARKYGFPTWRSLKSHVDAIASSHKALVHAVRVGDVATMRGILDVHPQLVNASRDLEEHLVRPSDARAMRLIHLAIAENQESAIDTLIGYGADLNVRNQDGRLPLHDCFELDRDHLGERLLAAGAQPDVCAMAVYGMRERLHDLLQSTPEAANDLQTGVSPLGWCVYGRHVECAQILIEHGALVDRPPFDAEAWAPAAHVGSVQFAKFFLAHGADPNCQDRRGDTPIHQVIKSRLVLDPAEFIKILLGGGADPSIRNKAGRTALDEAEEQVGRYAEAYFPARPIAPKKLDETIAILRAGLLSPIA